MKLTQLITLFALAFTLMAAPAQAWNGPVGHPGWGHPWHGPIPPCPYPPYPAYPVYPPYPPPPVPVPVPVPVPGYVFTCFAQNNFGAAFYASAPDANFAQSQALQFCFMSSPACVPVGCR